MRRHITLLAALALAVSAGCHRSSSPPAPTPPAHRVGAVVPGQFRAIPATYDPSVSGLPGAKGDIVQNAGSAQAWVKTDGTSNTAWQTFPGSSGGGSSNTFTAPLLSTDGGVVSIAAATESLPGSFAAADKTKLDGLVGVDTGHVINVGVDTTNVDITVNSTADGGWELWGTLIQASSDSDVYLEPAALATQLAVGGSYQVDSNTSTTLEWVFGAGPPDRTRLFITRGGGNSNRLRTMFSGRLTYIDGSGGWFSCDALQTSATTTLAGGAVYLTRQIWTGTDSGFTTLRIAASAANGIRSGSVIHWRALNFKN